MGVVAYHATRSEQFTLLQQSFYAPCSVKPVVSAFRPDFLYFRFEHLQQHNRFLRGVLFFLFLIISSSLPRR